MRDPYTVLGVPRNASEADIKRAFRALAKKHHPDQNADDPKAKERFSEISTAYEIIGDKDARQRYDRGEIGPDGKERFAGFGQAGGGFGGFKGFGTDPFQYRTSGGSSGGGAAFEDILKDIFGRAPGGGPGGPGPGARTETRTRGQPRSTPGEDLIATLSLTLEDLVSADKPTVTLPTGKTLQISVPDGVEDGQQIRLKGQGHASQVGGPAGDALITLELAPHPLFRRDGRDLRLDLPISLDEAVLGAKIRVPTLEGAVGLTIAPNTTGKTALRIRGKGLPDKAGVRGDLFVTPRIILPDATDKDLEKVAHKLKLDRERKPVRGSEFGG